MDLECRGALLALVGFFSAGVAPKGVYALTHPNAPLIGVGV